MAFFSLLQKTDIGTITTAKDKDQQTLIQGSHLAAGNAITVDTENLNVVASEDTSHSDSDTQSISGSVSFNTGGVTAGSIGGGVSHTQTSAATHENSTLSANTVNLTTTKDATIAGANIHGTEATTLNIGGNLDAASLQNSHTEKTLGFNASVGFADNTDAQGNPTGSTVNSGSLGANQSKGNYQAVTNQTSITGGTVSVNTEGNTNLKGVVIEGSEATSITTGTLTTENIENKASYESMSGGVSYSSVTTDPDNPTVANNQSNQPKDQKEKGLTPDIGMPQDVDKHSTTHTAVAENTVITITDEANQKEDTAKISRDTQNASYTMTEINTEVLDIRADISKEVSVKGFETVGNYAMNQEMAGDEEWADGGIKKTLAHAAMGATVAAIGNGNALEGAAAAGAREALSGVTKDADDATQQWVSAAVGAAVGGSTGATVAKDGEQFNRQLHQNEIKWIEQNAEAFAQELYGANPTDEQLADAQARLAQQSLRQVDKGWSLKLGSQTDKEAKSFLSRNNAKLFTVKDEFEFKDGSTNGKNEISALSKDDFNNLSNFYTENVNRSTTTNPDGTLRNANENYANEAGLIDAVKEGKIGMDEFNQAMRDLVPNTVQEIRDIPNTVKSAGNYVDAVFPTKNQERLDTLYGSHTDGSVLQANIATNDAISTGAMFTGVVGGVAVKGITKGLGALDDAVDGIETPDLSRVTGQGEVGESMDQLSQLPYQNSRPSYENGQVEQVWETAQGRTRDGKVYDPTGQEITWDQTQPRNGQWDMGHVPGEQYRDVHFDYITGGTTKEEFLEWYRNPNNYRPELPSTNREYKGSGDRDSSTCAHILFSL